MSGVYYKFRIQIHNRDKVQVYKTDPQKNDLGEPPGVFGYKGALKEQIDAYVAQAKANELRQGDQVKALGEALFKALFDDTLRQIFLGFYNEVVHVKEKLLRIELDIDEQTMPDVAALPWEFMRVPTEANSFSLWIGTAKDLIFSRRRSQTFPPTPIPLKADEKLRIAVAIAAPEEKGPVVYEPVVADLMKLAADKPDQFELLPVLEDANPVSLDALLAKEPHIFHFIGHGQLVDDGTKTKGQIALVHETGEVLWVDEDGFAEQLNQHRPGIVLLQACEGGMASSSQAFAGVASRIVQQNIPVVLAMQYAVTNSTAVNFARKFYQEVADDSPVDLAAQIGRRIVGLGTQYKKRDFATPVIFMRVEDGRLFHRQLTSSTPPEPVQQTQKLREELFKLNYKKQCSSLGDVLFKPKMSPFFISGPNQFSGQRWLLNRLVKEDLKDEFLEGTIEQAIRLDIARALTSQDVKRLWAELAEKLKLSWDTPATEITEALYEMWQERDVLIILDNVCHPGTTFPETILQEVWQPLVQRFKPQANSNWCLLFMVDNEGKLAAHEGTNINDPAHPVCLPPLEARFAEDELGTWLGMLPTLKALAPAWQELQPTSRDDFRIKLLARTDDGVPMVFVKELCRLCGHNWGELEGKWLTL